MPRRDGTGPNGQGPLTGGGFGFCGTPADVAGQGAGPAQVNAAFPQGGFWGRGINCRRRFFRNIPGRQGMGMGLGSGRGFRGGRG